MAIRPQDITFSAKALQQRKPEPFCLVVFGASGDLTRRKLLPAVYSLFCEDLLPEQTTIVGFARTDKTDQEFRNELWEATRPELTCRGQPVNDEQWARFASRLHYRRGFYDDPADYRTLRRQVESLAADRGVPPNCLFYLATPPDTFVPVVRRLAEAGLTRRGAKGAPWSRVVVEKPFGRDLDSARELNSQVRSAFVEEQIFRIDHYLGKETVQNILVLRFANSIFEPLWNHKYVDHVQITVAETLGVEGRGSYYDQSGAIRDMVQNHMMHLLCLVAMEAPIALEGDAVRNEKVKVLQAIRPIPPDCASSGVVQAQYAEGTRDGEKVVGYRQEPNVPPGTRTPTYVAFKAYVDNWRWSTVPFYLRTGKRLAARITEIAIYFKPVPQVLFNLPPAGPLAPNVLTVRVQPDEGISLQFEVKVPGAAMKIRPLKMDFTYQESFGSAPPEAYQRLLLDAALGDATLFTRSDEVEAAWRFVTPILEGCAQQRPDQIVTYPAGTWGPKAADELIAIDGNRWHLR